MFSTIHLIYTSRAVRPFDEAELEALAGASQRRNADLGVTGVLLYSGDRFLQMLEGDARVVDDLYYERIMHDPRHTDCTVLLRQHTNTRLFPAWTMGWYFLDDKHAASNDVWDNLCMQVATQSPSAIFAREPVVSHLHRFVMQFVGDNHADVA